MFSSPSIHLLRQIEAAPFSIRSFCRYSRRTFAIPAYVRLSLAHLTIPLLLCLIWLKAIHEWVCPFFQHLSYAMLTDVSLLSYWDERKVANWIPPVFPWARSVVGWTQAMILAFKFWECETGGQDTRACRECNEDNVLGVKRWCTTGLTATTIDVRSRKLRGTLRVRTIPNARK